MHIPETAFEKLALSVAIERWPIAGVFTTSHGSKTEAVVVVAEVTDGTHMGRGECLPYPRYGENPEEVEKLITSLIPKFAESITRTELQTLLPPGAARNALDCALWDLEAKKAGTPVWQLCGIGEPKTVHTTYTLSIDTPGAMAEKAGEAAGKHKLLKIKLAGDSSDMERLRLIREAAPEVTLITDANESWKLEDFLERAQMCKQFGVSLIEQPFKAANDEALRDSPHPVVICADESAHTSRDIAALVGKYDAVNIKLDKTGGLTEALLMYQAAREAKMKVMIGCMVATSLSMAPAMLLAGDAEYVDLDGALLLAKDREHGLLYEGDTVAPPTAALWG